MHLCLFHTQTVSGVFLSQRALSRFPRLFSDELSLASRKTTSRDHMVRTENAPRQKSLCSAEVIKMYNLSETVKGLTLFLKEPERKNAVFKAGQWIDMFIPCVETVGGFSICNSPEDLQRNGELDLAVKCSDHPPALWVHQQCKIGSRVDIRVGGNFYYTHRPGNNVLLIAGGVGINPLMSIFRHQRDLHVGKTLKSTSAFSKTVLVHSARTCDELIFQEKVKDICKTMEATCQFHVTKEKIDGRCRDDPPYWIYKNSKVTQDSLAAAASSLDRIRTDCYICGPPPFIEQIEDCLMAIGFPEENIFYEKWW